MQKRTCSRRLRSLALLFSLFASAASSAFAQTPQLVFTATVPERMSSDASIHADAVVEERGLALWDGTLSDFGVGVSLSNRRWSVRSIASVTTLPVDRHGRPTFQQVEVVRPMLAIGSLSLAGGGGVRQEWDGSRVLIGRVLAATDVARGRLQGSLVLEHVVSSSPEHDAADVVTSLGWSRRVGRRLSIGIAGIGQDLEGLWDPAEDDGGAKLLVGPSLRAQSMSGKWSASLTAGPVLQTLSTASSPDVRRTLPPAARHQFGMFASASWIPSLRH